MSDTATSHLYRRVTRLRWQAPLLALLLVLAHQIVEHTLLSPLPRWWHFSTQVLFYGLVGPALAWWALTSLRRSIAETEMAERSLQKAHRSLSEVNEHLTCLLRVNHQLTEAKDEETLLNVIIALPLEILPAVACSLIPFDQHCRPLPALHQGKLDTAVIESWTSRLADSIVREKCAACTRQTASPAHPCALLDIAPGTLKTSQIYCQELVRGRRTYGILNIYLPPDYKLSPQEQSLLQAMAQEMSMALESQDLRRRELDVLSRLQTASRLSELQAELTDMLTHTVAALGVDGGILFVANVETAVWEPIAEAGCSLGSELPLVQGLANGAAKNNGPLTIPDLDPGEEGTKRSYLIAPLRTEAELLGSLVLWAARRDAFSRHRTQLVAIVAGQAALLVANHRLYLQGEHKAILAERARLAREIHDGLAQTLAYLKLRMAQIAAWLQNEETERVSDAVAEVRYLLQEAYTDAREAIDSLHLQSEGTNLEQWLPEIITEFEMVSGLQVEMSELPKLFPPPEVQIQLQRIVQEALSNVRKHAHASHVWLEWQQTVTQLGLTIRDNGRGFDLKDIPPAARHGLRIMRERADLLDADFQIKSRRNEGTEIMIALPLGSLANEVSRE